MTHIFLKFTCILGIILLVTMPSWAQQTPTPANDAIPPALIPADPSISSFLPGVLPPPEQTPPTTPESPTALPPPHGQTPPGTLPPSVTQGILPPPEQTPPTTPESATALLPPEQTPPTTPESATALPPPHGQTPPGTLPPPLTQPPQITPPPPPSAQKFVEKETEPVIASPMDEPSEGENLQGPPPVFYDSDNLAPPGQEVTAPIRPLRKMSAEKDPASSLIIVKKEADADSPKAKYAAANRAMALGRYEAALAIYEKLYTTNKKDQQILMGRAVCLQKMGRYDAAIAAYEGTLEKNPKNMEAQVNMLGLMAERYPAVALRRLEELNKDNPDNPQILSQIAVVQAELGNFKDALAVLGVAASMDTTNPLHLYNMAVISDRMGDKKKALIYYEQALEVDSIYARGGGLPRQDIYTRLAVIR